MDRVRVALFAVALLSACGGDGAPAATGQSLLCADSDRACGAGCTPWDDLDCLDIDRVVGDIAYLASPALAGRGSGSVGNALAVEYVVERMRDLGLAPAGDPSGTSRSFRQRFPYSSWDVTEVPEATVGGSALAYPTDFTPLRFSGSADLAGLEAVFVGYGLSVGSYDRAAFPDCPLPPGHDDYAGADVRGKMVVALRGPSLVTCPSSSLTALWTSARDAGAAAVVVSRTSDVADGPPPYNAGLLPSAGADVSGIPLIYATRAALEQRIPQLAAWAEQLAATPSPAPHAIVGVGRVRVRGERADAGLDNVLAAIAGSDPVLSREVVVVGAHLDHEGAVAFSPIYFPGADDNASGTAVMLELARALASGPAPRRTVVFAAWNGEERGLLGSRHYVAGTFDALQRRQVLPDLAHPLGQTIAAFSVDMVGAGDGTGLLLYNGTTARASGLAAAVQSAAAARGMPSSVTPREPLDASDHVYFDRAGIPAVLALSRGDGPAFHAHYHTPTDTPDTLDRRDLETSTRVLWAALQRLALGEADPRPQTATAVRSAGGDQARMSSSTPIAASAQSAVTNAKRMRWTERATAGVGGSRITADLQP